LGWGEMNFEEIMKEKKEGNERRKKEEGIRRRIIYLINKFC